MPDSIRSRPGQLIEAKLDLVLGNDITSPVAIKEFARFNCDKVSTATRSRSCPTILRPIKISRRPSSAS